MPLKLATFASIVSLLPKAYEHRWVLEPTLQLVNQKCCQTTARYNSTAPDQILQLFHLEQQNVYGMHGQNMSWPPWTILTVFMMPSKNPHPPTFQKENPKKAANAPPSIYPAIEKYLTIRFVWSETFKSDKYDDVMDGWMVRWMNGCCVCMFLYVFMYYIFALLCSVLLQL